MQKMKENKTMIILAIIVIGIASIPYMNDFLLYGHDLSFHLGRIEGLAMALKNGDVLARMNPVNGYGYASGIMYPQLFLYVPAILRMLGMSLMNSYKIFIVLINVATFIIAYISVKGILRLQERYIALLASAFYTLGLYRLVAIYLRAALGEILAMTFLPILLWGMYELFFGDAKKWWIAVIGWTCVLQSHFLSVEIAVAFSALVFIIGLRKIFNKERILSIVKAMVLTLTLNAYFIVPFLQYFFTCDFQIFHMENDISATAVYFSQLFSVFVNNTGSMEELGATAGEMPVTIGVISLLTIGLYLVLRVNCKSSYDKKGDVIFLLALLAMFAASNLCPWGILYRFAALNKIVSALQFLFRLLSFASVFLMIMFAIDLCRIKEYIKEPLLVFLAIILIIGNCWYYLDSTIQTENVLSENGVESFVSVDGTYLFNEYPLLTDLYDRGDVVEVISDDSSVQIAEYNKKGTNLSFAISGCQDTVDIEVPLYYYPTYQAKLNGKAIAIEQGTSGVIRVKDVAEDGILEVSFSETPIWLLADGISCATLIGWVLIIVRRNKSKKMKTA